MWKSISDNVPPKDQTWELRVEVPGANLCATASLKKVENDASDTLELQLPLNRSLRLTLPSGRQWVTFNVAAEWLVPGSHTQSSQD